MISLIFKQYSTPFYISKNEVNVSQKLQEKFWLYRVA
ncbi:MAG: protein NO VEIN domain-containing protein [Aeromonas popoffii]